MKEERVAASIAFEKGRPNIAFDKIVFIEKIRKALYASKIISYAQGYALMKAAA